MFVHESKLEALDVEILKSHYNLSYSRQAVLILLKVKV